MSTFGRQSDMTTEALATLFETHRRTTGELYTALREKLGCWESSPFPPTQRQLRRARELDRAFELHRQAEAKIELLISLKSVR